MFKLVRRLIIVVLLGADFALLFGVVLSQPSHRMQSRPEFLPARSCAVVPRLCGVPL